jgi:fibro-slime domain-containing protein
MLVRLVGCASLGALLLACDGSGGGGSRIDTGGAGGSTGNASASGGSGVSNGGSGGFSPVGSGGNSNMGGDNCGSELAGVIRDFQSSHPDMEAELGVDPGIVLQDLGVDLKPVYAGDTPTTHGQAAFDQWYRDVMGVNIAIPYNIQLTEMTPGVYTFDNGDFFPIDGQGFNDEGNAHNYHFTYEIHASFTYQGGEVFSFTGDDDLFTYINGKLAIDLGGVHGPLSQTIDLDQQANALGIVVGQTYSLDFFFAERHLTQSNFRIDTSIICFNEVVPPT